MLHHPLLDIIKTREVLTEKQSGAAEACWAHNPEVRGSKPRSANIFLNNTIQIIKLQSPI